MKNIEYIISSVVLIVIIILGIINFENYFSKDVLIVKDVVNIEGKDIKLNLSQKENAIIFLKKDDIKCIEFLEKIINNSIDNKIIYVFSGEIDKSVVEKYNLNKNDVYSSSNSFRKYPKLVITNYFYKEIYDDLDPFEYYNFE